MIGSAMSRLDSPPPPPPDRVTPVSTSHPAAPDDGPTTAPIRLTRSRDDRVVGGVAAGIARHLRVDPVLVRLAFVVLALAGGGGVVAYLVAWLVIPEQPEGVESPLPVSDQVPMLRVLAGGVLVVLGANWLLHELVPGMAQFTLPILVIAVGVAVVVVGTRATGPNGGGR